MEHSFFYKALVFLGAAVLFVPLAKKSGLGSVLGYLFAGVIIGPSVMGFVGAEGQDIMHYAEFGVVMMLFLIGLELEPELLWKLRKSILGLGGLQVIVTTAAIAGIAMLFHFNWQQALALGMIFSLSSTAIVLQTMAEKGLMGTSAGQSAFSVLLFQDVAVIPMLALFPLLATTDILHKPSNDTHEAGTWVAGQPAWLHAAIVLGTIAAVIAVGRVAVRPLLRLVAKTNMREIFTATSLLIVVGIAVLMGRIGLSPALGAFLAGVVLANSEYRHELESDIEPFKGLLLGVFFIAVGASIDFGLVSQHLREIILWVCILIAVKSLVLLLLGKVFKMGTEQNFIFSFGLTQVGEFAFVLFSFSFQQGILSLETINIMTAVVAISMGLTPLIVMANEKLILPRVGTDETEERPADEIDEKHAVIIAGFGHFGSTIGRFLRANNVPATYLDMDSDRVDTLRKMGYKVFYGDASRVDLLMAAGADKAKIIVIAVNSPEKRLEMIETVKKHFPDLHMLVRAANRYDAYDLMNAGILHIYRESLDTSLRVGVDVMSLLGFRKYTARRLARNFIRYDEANLKRLSAIRNPDEYVVEARKYMEEIEATIQSDRQFLTGEADLSWDPDTLIEEVRASLQEDPLQ
ncbi:potassium transporter [Niastella yeongjuensis]|uniref:Potassium transporter n=1 Tax=Niastella yeongjuensis TaxID=354355 RepID=A0A1V9E9X8_9BACT|nr:monovalent cation:proton antiporter-2 (CPA2) family protein [Niastella yeongjuensis]OQP42906.1 potassium transporter [Niastella yeongjuensis]SEO58973.1 Kef-type potassium/proton antiporter, CPA2 family (TC 2.A.37.1) [Niastella yeongjuensis]